jgi:hypothetical protein
MIILLFLILLFLILIFDNNDLYIGGETNLVGEGWSSKVYKVDDKTVLRRTKIYPSDEFDKTQACWIELDFYNFIKNLQPDYRKHFLTLYRYKISKVSPEEFSMKYKHNTKHTVALSKSNKVMDQYITYVPISLIVDDSPNKILFSDYKTFIKTIYKCIHVIESNGWEYKDLHLGNIMMTEDNTYVLIDYGSAIRKKSDNFTASKIFIIKSLLFIDDKLGIPKFIGKVPLYDYIIPRIDRKLMTKIEKLINNPKLETDLSIPYNYLKGYEDTLKLDVIIYLNLFDRKQFFDIVKIKYKPMISDDIIPLLFKIMESKSYEEIIELV